MGRDKQIKNSKSLKKTTVNKSEPKRRCNEESSSSSDESIYSDEESEAEMDQHEYRKFLQKIFPSKHLENKIKAGKRLKKALADNTDSDYEPSANTETDDDTDDSDYIPKKHSTKNKQKSSSNSKPQNKNKPTKKDECSNNSKKYVKKNIVISDSEEEEEDSEEDEEEEDEEEEEKKPNSDKFNIILTINGKQKPELYDSEYDEEDDEEWETSSDATENEDDPVSSDSETEEEEEDVKPIKNKLVSRNKVNKKEIDKKEIDNNKEPSIIEALKELQSKHKDNNLINECIKVCEKKCEVDKQKMEKKVRKEKDRNTRIFKKILRDKNTMNDFEFYDKLDTTDQKSIIKELREINKVTRIEKPYRITLLESKIPVVFKATAMKKNKFSSLYGTWFW